MGSNSHGKLTGNYEKNLIQPKLQGRSHNQVWPKRKRKSHPVWTCTPGRDLLGRARPQEWVLHSGEWAWWTTIWASQSWGPAQRGQVPLTAGESSKTEGLEKPRLSSWGERSCWLAKNNGRETLTLVVATLPYFSVRRSQHSGPIQYTLQLCARSGQRLGPAIQRKTRVPDVF